MLDGCATWDAVGTEYPGVSRLTTRSSDHSILITALEFTVKELYHAYNRAVVFTIEQ